MAWGRAGRPRRLRVRGTRSGPACYEIQMSGLLGTHPGQARPWAARSRRRRAGACSIVDHPLREGFHAQRILALYRSGRQSDALAAYRELRALLECGAGHRAKSSFARAQQPSAGTRSRSGLAPARRISRSVALALPPPPQQRSNGRRVQQPMLFRVHPQGSWSSKPCMASGVSVIVVAMRGLSRYFRGRTMPLGPGRTSLIALAANAISKLDESGSVVASVPCGDQPCRTGRWPGRALGHQRQAKTRSPRSTPRHMRVQRVLDVGHDPQSLAVTGDDLWVANFADGTVSRINVQAARGRGHNPRGQRPGRRGSGTRWALGGQQWRQHHPAHRHRPSGAARRPGRRR